MGRAVAVLSVVACLGALLLPAPPAVADGGVHCGSVVANDVVLTGDLTCAGDGLIVAQGAAVTIDLAGHTLRGSGTGLGISTGAEAAGNVIAGLTVRGGTVTGFAIGIRALLVRDGTAQGTVRLASTRVTHNRVGLDAFYDFGPPRTVVTDSVFRDNSRVGIIVNTATITGSRFVHNGVGVAQRGSAINSSDARIRHSSFVANGTGVTCDDGSVDIATSSFRGNTVGLGGSVDRGAWLCYPLTVTRSRFTGGEVGVSVSYVARLRISGNSFTGATVGVELSSGLVTDSVVEANLFARNGASGLYVDDEGPPQIFRPLVIRANVFRDNGFAPAGWTTPSGGPLDAGAWANSGVFDHNAATRNAGYGIEGYDVVDGGGNRASGNGATAQCLGLTCAGT